MTRIPSGLLALVLILATAAGAPAAVGVGDELPALTLLDWEGKTVPLPPSGTQVMIVDFWASWCQPCRAALPRLDALSQRFAADGLRVFAVNIDQTRAPADAFLRAHLPTPTMTLLRDPDGAALARYGAGGMPALYVVDQSGLVRLVKAGFSADELRHVESLVGKLLSKDQQQ